MKYFEDPRLQALVSETDRHIFDMNGLLLHDEPIHLAAVNEALEPLRITVPEDYWIYHCVGHGLRQNLARIVNDGLCDADYERLMADYMKSFGKKVLGSAARPGVLDLIAYLGKAGKQRAIATSARRELAELILGSDVLGIRGEFYPIVTRDDAPDKASSYRLAASDSRRCVAYEDSGYGVDAAYEAGLPCIAVPSEFTRHQDFTRAAYIVDNLTPEARIIGGRGTSI